MVCVTPSLWFLETEKEDYCSVAFRFYQSTLMIVRGRDQKQGMKLRDCAVRRRNTARQGCEGAIFSPGKD